MPKICKPCNKKYHGNKKKCELCGMGLVQDVIDFGVKAYQTGKKAYEFGKNLFGKKEYTYYPQQPIPDEEKTFKKEKKKLVIQPIEVKEKGRKKEENERRAYGKKKK